ncbi:hypothetical protein E5D57_006577 [Metarhizium anisopliae]|nr:hypothetical protein E5D57_006577 [Metarhizium anisopliae]
MTSHDDDDDDDNDDVDRPAHLGLDCVVSPFINYFYKSFVAERNARRDRGGTDWCLRACL